MNANNTRAALVDRLFTTWRRCTAWSAKLAVALVAVSALFGVVQPGLSQPAVAQAYTFQGPDKVGYGRAVILFNRDETRKIGLGGLPAMPPGNPAFAAFNIAKAGLGAIEVSPS